MNSGEWTEVVTADQILHISSQKVPVQHTTLSNRKTQLNILTSCTLIFSWTKFERWESRKYLKLLVGFLYGSLLREPIAVMWSRVVDIWTMRDYPERVDRRMASIVMLLDVLHVQDRKSVV